MTDGDDAGADEFDTPLQADMRSLLNFAGSKPIADLHLKTAMIDILLDELGEESVLALRARPAGEALVVDRYQLADVLACERYYLENRDVPFSFTPATARGRVAGVVLRRWFYRDPRPQETQDWNPVDLVYEALEEIAQDSDRLGEFVAGLSPGGRADLAAAVTNVVLAFEET
ncbi:MAG: hypothetical protein M3173_08390, partial [Chloroflexota bacterium]|nr:hypothetical protein [Chloroflexota bacterium]